MLVTGGVSSSDSDPDAVLDTLGVIPIPAEAVFGHGFYRLDPELTLHAKSAGDRVIRALNRWAENASELSGRTFSIRSVGSDENADFSLSYSGGKNYPQPDMDESYRLRVSSEGIELDASEWVGVLRGLSTLLQLIRECEGQPCLPYVEVDDSPRFAWRGLLLDTVRHWIPVEDVKRQIDAMEFAKLNVLHLHFTDDQSFRVESFVYPRLHEYGSDGRYYRQEDIRSLVEYAADRGVRVVPEFGLPGHSRSWQIAYPDLAIDKSREQRLYAASAFTPPVDPTREYTYEFIDTLMAELLTLFQDPYVHMGGDEVKLDSLEDSAEISEYMSENKIESPADLIAQFSVRYAKILKKHGKTAIGWDEVLHEDLPEDVVIHLWRSTGGDEKILNHPVLLSTNYYLDHVSSAETHYRVDPTDLSVNGDSSAALSSNLLGVEITAWSEMHDEDNIDAAIWPRSLGIAERLWSPEAYTAKVDTDALYRRMSSAYDKLQLLGVGREEVRLALLEDLAAGGDTSALGTLAAVTEPTFLYPFRSRGFLAKYYKPEIFGYIPDEPFQLSSFTKALAYESLEARRFRKLVDAFIARPDDDALADELISTLSMWEGVHQQLALTMENSESLQQEKIDLLSEGLQSLSTVGLKLVEAHRRGNAPGFFERWCYERVLKKYRRLPVTYTKEYLFHIVKVSLFEEEVLAKNYLAVQPGIEKLFRSLPD